MAPDRLERRTRGVGLDLVIARDHPDLPLLLDADLGRAEDVTGGVERDGHAIDEDRLAVRDGIDRRVDPDPDPQDALAGARREVAPAAPACVIGVRVGDDRAIDGLPGIDEEPSGGAVEPSIRRFQQRPRCHGSSLVPHLSGASPVRWRPSRDGRPAAAIDEVGPAPIAYRPLISVLATAARGGAEARADRCRDRAGEGC
jgi:hypothetical protein